MKKPTNEFLLTLGDYVYTYNDPETDKILYCGKGVGSRGLSHIKTKGYSYDNLHIVGKNLERFGENECKSCGSVIKFYGHVLLESYIINKYGLHQGDNVADNKVAGHYKECFEMKKLNFMFNAYEESKRNFFEEADELRKRLTKFGNVGVVVGKQSVAQIESQDKQRKTFKIAVDSDKITISIWGKGVNDEWRDAFGEVLIEANYVPNKENKKTISWVVNSLDDAIDQWETFTTS